MKNFNFSITQLFTRICKNASHFLYLHAQIKLILDALTWNSIGLITLIPCSMKEVALLAYVWSASQYQLWSFKTRDTKLEIYKTDITIQLRISPTTTEQACPWIFFCFAIHKKLNKSCSLDKIFLFLKKKLLV